ncbi:MAG: hypothetical protein V2J20_00790 [Wenzhouxiangella sp.]|jgi:hypothetical protein|nr:hypothetical protein [Wenzhouxiangella sp.]
MNTRLILALTLLALAWYLWNPSLDAPLADELAAFVDVPTGFAAGVSIQNAPLQRAVDAHPLIEVDGFEIRPVADFQLEALILGRRDYHRGTEARLSPIDLALGWGPMAEQTVVDQVSIRQSGRFYYWQVESYPIPRSDIIENSANMHLIPANPAVFAELQRTEKGKRIRLRGLLVNIERDNGWQWRSSTTRSDSGNGACEIILVTRVEVY